MRTHFGTVTQGTPGPLLQVPHSVMGTRLSKHLLGDYAVPVSEVPVTQSSLGW